MSRAVDSQAGAGTQVARLLAEAERALASARLADAERALAGARALAPDAPQTRRVAGLVASRAGRHAEAIDALRAAIAHGPVTPERRDELAAAELAAGDEEGALETRLATCNACPDSAFA